MQTCRLISISTSELQRCAKSLWGRWIWAIVQLMSSNNPAAVLVFQCFRRKFTEVCQEGRAWRRRSGHTDVVSPAPPLQPHTDRDRVNETELHQLTCSTNKHIEKRSLSSADAVCLINIMNMNLICSWMRWSTLSSVSWRTHEQTDEVFWQSCFQGNKHNATAERWQVTFKYHYLLTKSNMSSESCWQLRGRLLFPVVYIQLILFSKWNNSLFILTFFSVCHLQRECISLNILMCFPLVWGQEVCRTGPRSDLMCDVIKVVVTSQLCVSLISF